MGRADKVSVDFRRSEGGNVKTITYEHRDAYI